MAFSTKYLALQREGLAKSISLFDNILNRTPWDPFYTKSWGRNGLFHFNPSLSFLYTVLGARRPPKFYAPHFLKATIVNSSGTDE